MFSTLTIFFKELSKLSPIVGLSLAVISSVPNQSQAQTASISASATYSNPSITTTTITAPGSTFINGVNGDRLVTNDTTQTVATIGAVTSVAVESVLPKGLFINTPVLVSPAYGTVAPGINGVTSLSLGGGAIGVVPENATFNRAAAQTLINAVAGTPANPNLELIIGIIRAGAGINGLD